jgi:hypothetical protein
LQLGSGRQQEIEMKFSWIVIAGAALVAGFGVLAADPAMARSRHHAKLHCADRPYQFSWSRFLFAPPPEPNGCAPAVFANGNYVGQDPDPNTRFQLYRDPDTGYTQYR